MLKGNESDSFAPPLDTIIYFLKLFPEVEVPEALRQEREARRRPPGPIRILVQLVLEAIARELYAMQLAAI